VFALSIYLVHCFRDHAFSCSPRTLSSAGVRV
jgi:hypothetical protein